MILDDVTMPEYERGLERSRTVLIPFGSLEEHGAHLPLCTDTLQVVEVCRRVAERTGAHVAPAVAYGVCRSTRNHPGTVGVTTATLRSIALDLVRDFHRHGMRFFVLISGHAGKTHLLTLVDAGEQLLDELPDIAVSVVSEYDEIRGAAAGLIAAREDSHAGEIETSRVLFLRPELVRGTSITRFCERFAVEARIAANLQHPSILTVYHAGQLDDGSPFIAMKLVQGPTLNDLLPALRRPSEFPRLLKIFEHICQAVAYCHDQGVIHRDLKPHNVMVGPLGEVQLMDWGLAATLANSRLKPIVSAAQEAVPAQVQRERSVPHLVDTTSPTADFSAKACGTLAYVAPEQIRDDPDLDERVDVLPHPLPQPRPNLRHGPRPSLRPHPSPFPRRRSCA